MPAGDQMLNRREFVYGTVAKALFMTVWRPSTRSAENSCGIRQG